MSLAIAAVLARLLVARRARLAMLVVAGVASLYAHNLAIQVRLYETARCQSRFLESGFRERFEAKGRLRPSLASIHTYVVTHKLPAFLGCAAVLAEASDVLTLHDIPHAAIDVDSLFLGHIPSAPSNDEVMYANLRSVCNNYASVGVQRFILARALETRTQLDLCREITSAANTTVCRLAASLETLRHRVKARESGALQQEFVARVAELNSILDRARLEDFTVANENRPLNEVAIEVLLKAGWISNVGPAF